MERLLGQEKLSLVVDLDQTILHATVDPGVHEWLHDPNHPLHKHTQVTDNFLSYSCISLGYSQGCLTRQSPRLLRKTEARIEPLLFPAIQTI